MQRKILTKIYDISKSTNQIKCSQAQTHMQCIKVELEKIPNNKNSQFQICDHWHWHWHHAMHQSKIGEDSQ